MQEDLLNRVLATLELAQLALPPRTSLEASTWSGVQSASMPVPKSKGQQLRALAEEADTIDNAIVAVRNTLELVRKEIGITQ